MSGNYEIIAREETMRWQAEMQRRQGIGGRLASAAQGRINRIIPEKVHEVITTAFRHMVNGVLQGSKLVSGKPLADASLQQREQRVLDRINVYKNTSAAEGAITGAGGILLGLADFPIWLTIKMKMLSDIALQYGYDISDYKERVFMLHVFQLAFSGRKHRRKIFATVADWERYSQMIPEFDEAYWRTFQQEYRDYLDLAKLLQLIPGIGAVVGFYVNNKLTKKLGETAMNAYRMRYFNQQKRLE